MNTKEAHDLFARILRGIAPEIDIDDVDTSTPMQDVLDIDSIDFLNLVTAVYQRTGIDIPEHDYPLVSTIDSFIAYLAEKEHV